MRRGDDARPRTAGVLTAVAAKTVRRNWRDLRFQVLAVVVLAVGWGGGVSSGKLYDRAKESADWAAQAARSRSDLERAIFVRTPSPWSVVREGGEHALPDHLVILPGFVDYPRRAIGDLGSFPSRTPDWTFIVVYLLSLAAIIAAFDGVASEREAGTLEAVLVEPVSRVAVLAGLFFGTVASLLPLVVVGFLVHTGTAAAASSMNLGRLDPWVLVGILILSVLLIVCMSLAGCLASVVAGSTVGAGLLALLFWTVATLLVPKTATLVAEVVHPTPSFRELEIEIDSAQKRFLASTRPFSSMEIRDIVERKDLSEDQKRHRLGKLQAEISEQHQGRLRTYKREVMELRGRYLRALSEQADLAAALSKLSPVGLFQSATEALVGTGRVHQRRFVRQAHEFMARYTRIAETGRTNAESRIYGPVIEESGVELHAVLWESWRGAEIEEAERLTFRGIPPGRPGVPELAIRDGVRLLLISILLAISSAACFR